VRVHGTLTVTDGGIGWAPGWIGRLRRAPALHFDWRELGGVTIVSSIDMPFRGGATATLQLVGEPWLRFQVLRSDDLEHALDGRAPVRVVD